MNRIATLLLTFALPLSFSNAFALPIKTMIVGGGDAAVNEFPFIVSLQARRGGHFCGGSLIRPNWILTASHCMEGSGRAKVVVGLYDQGHVRGSESFAIKQVIMHPQFDSTSMDYDFALIEIRGNSAFTPIELNTTEIQIPNLPVESMATVAGWGDLSGMVAARAPDILQKVDVPLVTKDSCEQSYKGQITDRMLCAGYTQGGKDSCQGDSGGPLIIKDPAGRMKLAGVVSWGEGCAQPNFPGIYSKVSSVIDWINLNAQ